VAKQISRKDKTCLAIDREKVERAKEILDTETLTETVDAALEDVINHDRRMSLLERIRRDGGIGPSPDELRRLRRPRLGPVPR
jgi:hypothetical protein